MKKNIPQQKGFVILFAILISVIILLLGMGIFSVATKESILSSSAREAQYAFAAADTGSECSLYAEANSLFNSLVQSDQTFSCADGTVDLEWDAQPGFFSADIFITGTTTCAHITVTTNGTSRTIKSQGYNLCNTSGQPQLGNPRLVERDLEITYAIPGTVQVPGQNPGGMLPGQVVGGGSSQINNNSGLNTGPSNMIGSSQIGNGGQMNTGQLMQMQVQTPPQDLVIPKFLPVSDSSAQTAQVNTSNTTPDSISPIKTASQSIARTAQSVADVVDSAFRAVVNLVR